MNITKIIFSLCFFISHTFAHPVSYNYSEKIFYLTSALPGEVFSQDQVQQIQHHAKSIDIIAPQIFELGENGDISGNVDQQLLEVAKNNNLKVMPLIMNPDFDKVVFHNFLHDSAAQKKAIRSMLTLCQKYHFHGLQFDFENINFADRVEFTKFFQLTAQTLQEHGFILSIAVVVRTSDPTDGFNSAYDQWYFENWSGAYDYAALGRSANFISVMSYDRHSSLTTPGPIAANDWVEKTIKYLLKVVPANKISLGIPDYSGYWSTGTVSATGIPEKYTFRSKEKTISYTEVLALLEQFNLTLNWQDEWKTSYTLFSNHDRIEYLFVEDAKSFQAKLDLAEYYHLRGISVWKLGLEDPAIWNVINSG